MPEETDNPAPTPPAAPAGPVVMGTPIHDQIAAQLGVRQKHRRPD
ncbi:hypothetical protein [Nocardia sp. NRRL S-836]|nr:hypothetical protein [Nocardia sp. NRRL S-836]